MTVGFVLISCEHGFEKIIMKKLLGKKEILEANRLSGMYDIIVKIESASPDTLQDFVIWKIRKIDKIRSVVSLLTRESVDLLAD